MAATNGALHVHQQDTPSVDMAIAAANSSEGIDLEFRLLMPDARIKCLHVVGKAESCGGRQL
jgi:hypothetical protein